MPHPERDEFDLLIIGGGINGVGVARDASGRGLAVALCERGDLGGATSSASTKLIHGGLRYLEHFEFRLVREALRERETLLAIAPHAVRPLRFLMPHAPGRRPGWMIRAGLFLYDHLGRRVSLPASHAVALDRDGWGQCLEQGFRRGYLYSDCWADDARLVVLNARDADARGAAIWPRTRFVTATASRSGWRATLECDGARREVHARVLVNAGGPWVNDVLAGAGGARAPRRVRLVKGSHMVVDRLCAGEHALILQNDDGRVVFVIPYEDDFSLIGTTDVVVPAGDEDGAAGMSDAEADYLCRAVNRYLARKVSAADCRWSYAGVRPLFDDGEDDPSKLTRDYALEPGGSAASPLLSIYGGKLTTYRRLAERVLERLAPHLPAMGPAWTATAALPGGDLPPGGLAAVERDLAAWCPALDARTRRRLAQRHGSRCREVLAGPDGSAHPGTHFGADLYAAEIDYMIAREWALGAEDVLWRRSKAGLHLDPAARAAVAAYVAARVPAAGAVAID